MNHHEKLENNVSASLSSTCESKIVWAEWNAVVQAFVVGFGLFKF